METRSNVKTAFSQKVAFCVCDAFRSTNQEPSNWLLPFFTAAQLHIDIQISGLISIFIKCGMCRVFAQRVTYYCYIVIMHFGYIKLVWSLPTMLVCLLTTLQPHKTFSAPQRFYFKCENFCLAPKAVPRYPLHTLRVDKYCLVTKASSMMWNSNMRNKLQLWCVCYSVGASPLDTTTIHIGTVSCTYPQHVYLCSSLETCHYFLMTFLSCPV